MTLLYENAHLKFASYPLQFILEAFSYFVAFVVLQSGAETRYRSGNR